MSGGGRSLLEVLAAAPFFLRFRRLLSALVLEGRVVTVDALRCPRKGAGSIVARGGTP